MSLHIRLAVRKESHMKVRVTPLALTLFLVWTHSSWSAPYRISPDSIFRHISVLASDSLEGRETGEAGEWKATQYLAGLFKQIGLEPKGDRSSYLQPFDSSRGFLLVPGINLK